MFSSMKIGTKLIGAFLILTIIAVGIGGAGYIGMSSLATVTDELGHKR